MVSVVAVAVMACVTVLMARWMFDTASKRTQMILAQADEHTKMAFVAMEKSINRLFAAANPESFERNRRNSGTIEGAQYATKLHVADPPKSRQEAKERVDQVTAQLRRQQELQEARVAAAGGGDSIPVGHPMDFENLNGVGRP